MAPVSRSTPMASTPAAASVVSFSVIAAGNSQVTVSV